MISTTGAIIGILIAIFLIVRKMPPAYALIIGALFGGIIGNGSLTDSVSSMISGAQSMMPAVLRILASGILAGALIKTGSAQSIAYTIVKVFGPRLSVLAIALATMLITAVGVFVDIAVITVAPIALAVGRKSNLTRCIVLIALIGGGKAGNIISPNPNTIACSEAFNIPLSDLIIANAIPALCAFLVTVLICMLLQRGKVTDIDDDIEQDNANELPKFYLAAAGPLTVVGLMMLRPIAGISIDPLISLPAGGFVCICLCGGLKKSCEYMEFGLSKVAGVSILLVATGAIAGIIRVSSLQSDMVAFIEYMNVPMYLLAPFSGILMAAVTSSTTAGATIAAQTFSSTLISASIDPVPAAAMMHAGATVADSFPHGTFFHASAGAVFMKFSARMRIIPYEMAIGFTSTIVCTVLYMTGN